MAKERVQKIIAAAGICSRRNAEELITEGAVTINGKKAKLGDQADPATDHVKVNGKLITQKEKPVYIAFHKPKGVICMLNEDVSGRTTLQFYLKRVKERVFPVGRMDFTESGLVLLTNDGEFAERLRLSRLVVRSYSVKVGSLPTEEQLEKLGKAGKIDGKVVEPFHVDLGRKYDKSSRVEISFMGMRPFDMKEWFRRRGLLVEQITKTAIGHFLLKGIPEGEFRYIKHDFIPMLFDKPERGYELAQVKKEKRTAKDKKEN